MDNRLPQGPQDASVKRLLSDAIRISIEQHLSAYLGRAWRVTAVQSRHDEASHPAAILSDGVNEFFVKLNEGELAWDQLTQEVAGLRLLTTQSGVRTPAVIGLLPADGGALVIMEAVQIVTRTESHWRQMGRALAQVHNSKGEFFGLGTHCYWGSLYQDNTPHADWPAFFWARRIEPRLQAAVDSGNLPMTFVPYVEKLGSQLAQLCGPVIQPSLLHGDAHANNFLSTIEGPVLIDPAAYYGHPEIDLALVDFFMPVPDDLFDGYGEVAPLDAGFGERHDLWLVPAWLAMVEVDGPQHLAKLRAALHTYL